jgi:dolichol-phosphate mannosyltransferase
MMKSATDRDHSSMDLSHKICVVIPCYQAQDSIIHVVIGIGPEVDTIYCVDDCSQDNTATVIKDLKTIDPRVRLIQRKENGGVGAAVIDGMQAAIKDGMTVIVKIDSDGQMDPKLIPAFCKPILDGDADYVKGNRFFFLESVKQMPLIRVLGNAGLSFLTKLSTGYWESFDPTNGYTALNAQVAATLPFEKIAKRYFFESDILFRLGIIRAQVVDLPLECHYGEETSNLSVTNCLLTFPAYHARNFGKRIFYNYFVRNFSMASMNLVLGSLLTAAGTIFGSICWLRSASFGQLATPGTVMLAALPVMIGIQLLLSFLAHDITMTPNKPIHRSLSRIQLLTQNHSRTSKQSKETCSVH